MRYFSDDSKAVNRICGFALFSMFVLAATPAHSIPTGPEIALSSGFLLSVQNSNGGPSNLAVSIESRAFSFSESATGGGVTSITYSQNEYSACGVFCFGLGPTLFRPGINGLAKVVDGGGTASVSAQWQFDIVLRQTDPRAPDGINAILGAAWLQPGTIGRVEDISNETVSASWNFAIGGGSSPRGLAYFDSCSAPLDLFPLNPNYPYCDGIYPNFPDSAVDGVTVVGAGRELSIPAQISLLLFAEKDAPFPVPAPGSLLTLLTAIAILGATPVRRKITSMSHSPSRHG